MRIKLEVEGANEEQMQKYHEILFALISCGGLSGVKGGKTILHFDADGVFQGVELDYWPWKRKKQSI